MAEDPKRFPLELVLVPLLILPGVLYALAILLGSALLMASAKYAGIVAVLTIVAAVLANLRRRGSRN